MQKALIRLGPRCNNSCVFCHAKAGQSIAELTESEGRERIEAAMAMGADMVVFSGGEPTIHPCFLRLAAYAASRNLRVGLVSNARMLAYGNFFQALLRCNCDYALVSLHAPDPALHDRLVSTPTAFSQTVAGLRRLVASGIDTTVNLVLHADNLGHLRQMVEFMGALNVQRLKFSLMEPKGRAKEHFETVVPSLSDCARAVVDAMGYLTSEDRGKLDIGFEGFPQCLIPDFACHHQDLLGHGFRWVSEPGTREYFFVDHGDRGWAEPCDECALRNGCPGSYRAYIERRGSSELRPARGLHGNSFNLVHMPALDQSVSDDPCPAQSMGAASTPPARHVFLRSNGRLHGYHCDAVDWCDEAILDVKWKLGQIYLANGVKHTNINIKTDLTHCIPAERCLACARRESCPGIFEVDPANRFDEQETTLREHISSLRGRILDIGHGDNPYADILARSIQEQSIVYVGIDPQSQDEDSPGRTLRRACAEDYDEGPASFDHVVLFRSYNHLSVLDKAFDNIVQMLRTGGSLLVVDSTRFGILRSAGFAPLPASSGSFGHYRNHTSLMALSHFRRYPLGLVRHEPVSPSTCNQWFLLFRKDSI